MEKIKRNNIGGARLNVVFSTSLSIPKFIRACSTFYKTISKRNKSMKGIIYKATNLINGKIYIGKTVKTLKIRKTKHKSAALNNKTIYPFYRAIRKYGFKNFEWKIIDYALTEEILFEMEKYYIKKLKTKAPDGYNSTDGGEGMSGLKHTDETKRKLSKHFNGRSNERNKKGKYVKCLTCGKEVWVIPSREKSERGKYCSRECENFRRKREYVFVNPKGEEIVWKGFREFCRINGLNIGCMQFVLNNKQDHHKGWRVRKIMRR